MNLKLITETTTDFDLLEEGSGKDKDLFIVGIFSSAELKNANGRVYRKPTLEREVGRLQEENFKKGIPLWGTLGHPNSPETDLEKVAIKTVMLEWRGNDLYGKAKVMKGTPCGDIAATLLKDSKLGISSRGLGQVDEEGYVTDESYKLITWDLVNSASNYPSYVNGIYEGRTFDMPDKVKEPTAKELKEELKKQQQTHFKNILNMFEGMENLNSTVKTIEDIIAKVKAARSDGTTAIEIRELERRLAFHKAQFKKLTGQVWSEDPSFDPRKWVKKNTLLPM
jgi:hypothetical protein